MLKSKRVPIPIKVRVYQIYVLSVVLHGLDCISWTKDLLDSIEVFQNHVMRFIVGKRLIDKTRISTLREKTSLPPLFCKIKSKTLKTPCPSHPRKSYPSATRAKFGPKFEPERYPRSTRAKICPKSAPEGYPRNFS